MEEENIFFDYTLEPGKSVNPQNKISIYNVDPLISIVTSYYNDKNHIGQTLNSMLNQTFPYWEWIIVNDGSTEEGTHELLEQLCLSDSRIKILHKENEGLACRQRLRN